MGVVDWPESDKNVHRPDDVLKIYLQCMLLSTEQQTAQFTLILREWVAILKLSTKTNTPGK